MRKIIKIGLFSVLLASTSAIAAEHQHMNHDAMQTMQTGPQWTDGIVKKVDPKGGKITVKHAAISGSMPAMTMSYKVAPSLPSVQAGDKVRFILENNVVTRIETVR